MKKIIMICGFLAISAITSRAQVASQTKEHQHNRTLMITKQDFQQKIKDLDLLMQKKSESDAETKWEEILFSMNSLLQEREHMASVQPLSKVKNENGDSIIKLYNDIISAHAGLPQTATQLVIYLSSYSNLFTTL